MSTGIEPDPRDQVQATLRAGEYVLTRRTLDRLDDGERRA